MTFLDTGLWSQVVFKGLVWDEWLVRVDLALEAFVESLSSTILLSNLKKRIYHWVYHHCCLCRKDCIFRKKLSETVGISVSLVSLLLFLSSEEQYIWMLSWAKGEARGGNGLLQFLPRCWLTGRQGCAQEMPPRSGTAGSAFNPLS